MKKNILIINRCLTDNIGDQAISRAMKSLVEELSSANVYTVDLRTGKLSDSLFFRIKHKVYILLSHVGKGEFAWKMENRSMFNVLNKVSFDLVLIGGGELLQSNGIFPMALDAWTKKIRSKQPQAKIYLFGVGVTQHYTRIDTEHISKMLERISGVVVRDQASKDNLFNVFGMKANIIPDVVFSMKSQIYHKNNRRGILYGLTNWDRINKYGLYAKSIESYYQKSFDAISAIGGEVKLFYTTNNDYKECIRFQSYAKNRNMVVDIVKYDDLDSLLTLLNSTDKVYSPRMHGCILADLCGCRTEPIIISPKMESYKSSYKKPLDTLGLRARIIEEMTQLLINNNII